MAGGRKVLEAEAVPNSTAARPAARSKAVRNNPLFMILLR
jgi:hypothetical protein